MFKSIKEVKQRMSEFTTQVSKIPFVLFFPLYPGQIARCSTAQAPQLISLGLEALGPIDTLRPIY
jgi:hypothetical protein